ncbi:MAG TPA: DUF3500 domain-containing protein [Stellaceae bacterium]|nr:DUF3500 domain-containing protein [Stellaceae bacterium]
MADGMNEPGVRKRHPTPARAPFKMPERLQQMLDRGKAEIAAPFKGITADGTVPPGLFRLEKTGVSPQPVIDAADAFLAALSPAQRRAATFPVDSDAWRSWSNIHPFMLRHGVLLETLDGTQREGALALIRASLGADGYRTARDVMKLNETILEITQKPDEYGEWLYWVSVMGEPSASAPWGWQIDGHHLIINCFVLGDQLVVTPLFMGSEPVHARSGKYAGTRVFEEEERKGFLLMSALTPEQRAKATIGMNLPLDVITTAFHDNMRLPYQGIRYAELSREQRELVERLLGLYVGRIRPGHAEIRYAEAKRHLDDTYFAWMGHCDDASPFYYRLHSPVVLIEFDHQPGIALDNDEHSHRHIHTIVRTPNGNDYGNDLLRQHYAAFDHNNPRSPHRQGRT